MAKWQAYFHIIANLTDRGDDENLILVLKGSVPWIRVWRQDAFLNLKPNSPRGLRIWFLQIKYLGRADEAILISSILQPLRLIYHWYSLKELHIATLHGDFLLIVALRIGVLVVKELWNMDGICNHHGCRMMVHRHVIHSIPSSSVYIEAEGKSIEELVQHRWVFHYLWSWEHFSKVGRQGVGIHMDLHHFFTLIVYVSNNFVPQGCVIQVCRFITCANVDWVRFGVLIFPE
jgi:hypothetical protein